MDNFTIIRALLGGQFPTYKNFMRWLICTIDYRSSLYSESKSEFRLTQLKSEFNEGSLLVGIFKEDIKEFIVHEYYCELIEIEDVICLYDLVLVFRKEENQRVLKKIDSPLQQYRLRQALNKKNSIQNY